METKDQSFHDQTFMLLLERFDRVDKDNDDIKKSIAAHVQADELVHNVVEKHSTYWGLLFKIGLPLVVALLLSIAGKFGYMWGNVR